MTDSYSLLEVYGRDRVGVLQFVPEGETVFSNGVSKKVSVTYSEIARKIGNQRK